MHVTNETPRLMCVTVAKRFIDGCRKDPKMRKLLWWHTNAGTKVIKFSYRLQWRTFPLHHHTQIEFCHSVYKFLHHYGLILIFSCCVYLPKLMTPIAWKTSLLMKSVGLIGAPRISAGIFGPSMRTVIMITKMADRANALVLASLDISRYIDNGQDTRMVNMVIHNRRLENIHKIGMVSMLGTNSRITWGMVSPTYQ